MCRPDDFPPHDDFRAYWRDEVAGRGPVVRFVTDPRLFVPFSSLPEDEQREWLEWLNGKIETTRPYIDMVDVVDPKQAPSWDSTPMTEPTTRHRLLMSELEDDVECICGGSATCDRLADEEQRDAVNAALDKVAAACIGLQAADLFMPHRVAAAIAAARPKP